MTMNETKITTLANTDTFRHMAERALSKEGGFNHETRNGGLSALADLSKSPPDILIIQDACEDPSQFEALSKFTEHSPSTSVILACQSKDPDMMVKAIHSGVKEFLFEPVQEIDITTIAKRLAATRKVVFKGLSQSEVMVFLPCKGGSGATFISTNVAHIIAAEQKKRVLFIDLNLQFGDAYLFLMDHMPPSTLTDVCAGFKRLDASFLESACVKLPSGLHLLPAPKNPVDAEIVKPEHIEGIVALARTQYDFIVIDAGRNMEPVAIKALDLADHVYPVLQLTLPYLRDAKRMKDMFQELGYSESKVRWVINRYGAEESLSLADAKRVLAEAYWTVPNDHENVSQSVNQGIPIAQLAPKSRCTRSLMEWVSNLVPQEQKQHSGLFGRLFGH